MKALKWLNDHQIAFKLIDIALSPPKKEILIDAISQLGDRKKIFNTSGLSYRKLGASFVKAMSDSEAIAALAADGKLIKRPFLITSKGEIHNLGSYSFRGTNAKDYTASDTFIKWRVAMHPKFH